MSQAPKAKRSKSDPPPPIMVEDTTTGAEPQPSPSPTQPVNVSRSFPQPQRNTTDPTSSSRRNSTWGHRRKPSPGVEWKEKWTKETWKHGRVLLIDYVAREHTSNGRRKIVAQELHDLDGLRKFYAKEDLSQQAALRVIHVQNAPWATKYLLRKFNIDHRDDLIGTSFGRWAKFERPQLRGGKPVLNGKTFRTQRDPWRGIGRAAFGLDYLRHYEKGRFPGKRGKEGGGEMDPLRLKMMELNHYDAVDNPTYGFDVFVQRLSVYVQRREGEPYLPVDPEIRNPYNEAEYMAYQRVKEQYGSKGGGQGQVGEEYVPRLKTLDNGNTIIIFEHSQSGSVEDTLIGARQEIESRWRRLTFYLPREDASTDDHLALECMDFILRDIFKALAFTWEKYLTICETHVSILEDKIYENPADESRAPELWTNSSLWLKVERLLFLHGNLIKEFRGNLRELADDEDNQTDSWLGSAPDEFEKLTTQFQEGVVKPTSNLSDLMYKSVGIRDARHSLQLGLSMWRLSWITFIFLPLTFTVGFFGMNVDTFTPNPSIKWYFISSVPLLLLVLLSWYAAKHTLSSQRQDPLRRGVYESLFHELAVENPGLWTRRGPRGEVVPVGWWSTVKWRLVSRWFAPDRTILAKGYDAGDEELGVWSRVKRSLAKRWLGSITVMAAPSPPLDDLESSAGVAAGGVSADLGAVRELLSLATPVAVADADPTAASRLNRRVPLERYRSLSPPGSEGREGSRRSEGSGVMVEEKGNSEDERSGDEGGTGVVMQRLTVPVYSGGL